MPIGRRLWVVALLVGCSSSSNDSSIGAPDPDDVRTLVTDPPPGAPEDADASGVDVFGDWGMDPDVDDESVELGGEPTEGTFTDDDASAAEEDPVAEAPEGDGPADGDIEGVYEGSASASTPDHPRCRKKIFVTFLAYGAMPELTFADTNGCWKPQRLMQDPIATGSTVKMWRECHYDGDGHTGGNRWFYDATNASHDSDTELKRVAKCNAAAGGSGYTLLEARPASKPRWRIVNPRGTHLSSFFAELYSSEDVLDDYWLMSSAYRKNKYLRKYKRMAPMINVGYQYGSPGMFARARKIRNETLKVCNSIKKGGRLGIHTGKNSPLTGEREAELVFFAVKNAIDQCTGIQLTCDQMGGKICEVEKSGACSGKGPASSDCDHCCGGIL